MEQMFYLYTICSSLKISLPIDCLAVLHRSEENNSSQSVTSDEQEHAHYDEETLIHADEDGLHQHFQSGVLASDSEETQDDHDIAKRKSVLKIFQFH